MRALVLAVCLALGCSGGASFPARFDARATVSIVAVTAQAAGDFCATAASVLKANGDAKWKPLATKCADGYDTAKNALHAAAAALDVYDEASAGKVACAVLSGLNGAESIVGAMDAAGLVIPKYVSDSLVDAKLAASWAMKLSGGVCYQPPKDGGK